MNSKSLLKSALLAGLAVALTSTKSVAHAPVANSNILPLAHSAAALRLLTGKTVQDASFNTLTKALLASRLTPYSRGLSLVQTKEIVGSGILNGIKARLSAGPLSGSYYGTVYQRLGSTSPIESFFSVYQGYGSNPLAFSQAGFAVIPNPSTVLINTKTAGFASVALAKELGSIKGVIASNPTFALQYNSLKEGEAIAATGLTGGQLSGTLYQNIGNLYLNASQNVFTFGTNPFNTGFGGSTTLNPFLSGSYLTFLNKINVPVSSGQLIGNLYNNFPGTTTYTTLGIELLAIGKNPLNNLATFSVLSSAIKNLSYLKF